MLMLIKKINSHLGPGIDSKGQLVQIVDTIEGVYGLKLTTV